ncbi:MAG: MarR family winged helix-turn-helix transcriptional regulator [Christensenellales bacterium]|jgi:MarR family transcriptional regulator for hemolysin
MNNMLIQRFSFIHRRSGIHLDRQLKNLNISFGQFLYILCICENEGLSQENISCRLKIDKGSVARTLKQLEANGYILRIVSPDDRRTLQIFPTDKAKRQYAQIAHISSNWENVLTHGLTDIEVAVLVNLLDKVIENMTHC